MLKLKHLRRPLRTLSIAKEVLTAHLSMKVLGPRGEARFQDDSRYDLQNVEEGFASRLDGSGDDTAILQRICGAYIRAAEQEPFVKKAYRPTGWWKEVRKASLAPVRRALATRDNAALHAMYGNFFRDPCSSGLIGVPYKMNKAYSGQVVDNSIRRFFLSNALHRIDHWKAQTGNRFVLRDLAGPDIGNPFGVSIEGTLIRAGTESQNYAAHRIEELLPSDNATVAEIGGGFGGMAYYLLRDRPQISYINFDVPESVALASYYLLRSFPMLTFQLYEEEALSSESLARFSAVLMPVFELVRAPTKSVDLAFSSHTMSSLTRTAMVAYLDEIIRMTRRFFLYVGRAAESGPLQKLICGEYPSLSLVQQRRLEWNKQKIFSDEEVECLYQIAPS